VDDVAELGALTIHVSIGAEPLSVEASRIFVLADPADGLELIAEHTVDAPTAPTRRVANGGGMRRANRSAQERTTRLGALP
jgi:hypothetical protein